MTSSTKRSISVATSFSRQSSKPMGQKERVLLEKFTICGFFGGEAKRAKLTKAFTVCSSNLDDIFCILHKFANEICCCASSLVCRYIADTMRVHKSKCSEHLLDTTKLRSISIGY